MSSIFSLIAQYKLVEQGIMELREDQRRLVTEGAIGEEATRTRTKVDLRPWQTGEGELGIVRRLLPEEVVFTAFDLLPKFKPNDLVSFHQASIAEDDLRSRASDLAEEILYCEVATARESLEKIKFIVASMLVGQNIEKDEYCLALCDAVRRMQAIIDAEEGE